MYKLILYYLLLLLSFLSLQSLVFFFNHLETWDAPFEDLLKKPQAESAERDGFRPGQQRCALADGMRNPAPVENGGKTSHYLLFIYGQ
jgi:hypothetical protein